MTNYCTAAELRTAIKKNLPDDDTFLNTCIAAASTVIDRFCNRPDGFQAAALASAKTYPGTGTHTLPIDECVEITLVEIKHSPTDSTYEALLAADWVAFTGDPKWPNFNKLPFDWIMMSGTGANEVFHSGRLTTLRGFRPDFDGMERNLPTVRVTARWGYAVAAPENVKAACIAQAARWFKRSEGAWADTLGTADTGLLLYRRALDPDIQMLLQEARMMRPLGAR